MGIRLMAMWLLCLGVLGSTPVVGFAQFGNSISGFVFGLQRQPVRDAPVELMDDFSRTIARTRTNGSGQYSFTRVGSGRFRVRAFSVPGYKDQDQEVEIQNISMMDGSGNVRTSGYENVQRDFYLSPIRDEKNGGKPVSIFVQDVPAPALETFKAGIKKLDGKNTDEGLKDIKHAIELFPDYYEALEKLGTEYVKLKHFVPAQILLQRAVEINPRGYSSWFGLAYSLNSLNVIKEGLEAAEKATELNPTAPDSTLLLGVLLRRSGRFQEAEATLKKANTLGRGELPQGHWQLAQLYANDLKRYDDAVHELELFLKASPNNKDTEAIKKLIKELKDKSRETSTIN